MLSVPTVGFGRSVDKSQIKLDALCDWIEGSLLFSEYREIFASEVVDILCEEEIVGSQELGWEIVQSAWTELGRRQSWVGSGVPFRTKNDVIDMENSWRNNPAYSFCIVLSCAKWYPDWSREYKTDYNAQGHLFELLTKESVAASFPEWKVHLTGWTKEKPEKLPDVVEKVANLLSEPIGDLKRWAPEHANEAGLDLLLYYPFYDGRVGLPVFLMQCASGKNYSGKFHTPNLNIWEKIVNFAATPRKAFAMPFALTDADFIRACNLVDGPLFDRYRLLAPGRSDPDWVSESLKKDILEWIAPKIDALPRSDE